MYVASLSATAQTLSFCLVVYPVHVVCLQLVVDKQGRVISVRENARCQVNCQHQLSTSYMNRSASGVLNLNFSCCVYLSQFFAWMHVSAPRSFGL